MKKTLFFLATMLIIIGFFGGCGKKNEATMAPKTHKIMVYTSLFPVYDFTRKIGGDKVEVKNIVPPGGEPHQWEPTPQDIAAISKADVLILGGAGMEHWGDKVLGVLDTSGVTVVKASQNVRLVQGDPHFWVDPLNARIMVDNILAVLIQVDAKNKVYYLANAMWYKKELDRLHEEYRSSLARAKTKEFVTSHAAFGYLARRYGLTEVPIRGISPEVEPTPGDMSKIIKTAREKNIHYIFLESLVSPKVSQTIAGELKAEVLELNPMDGLNPEEIASGQDYFKVMRQNLKNLQKALGSR